MSTPHVPTQRGPWDGLHPDDCPDPTACIHAEEYRLYATTGGLHPGDPDPAVVHMVAPVAMPGGRR